MTYLEAIGLGALQGVAEFLPISSSGHLALAKAFLGTEDQGITVEVLLHVGTALSFAVLYARELVRLALAPRGLFVLAHRPALAELALLAVATLPAAVIGLVFKQRLEAAFADPRLISGLLVCTGVMLVATSRLRPTDGSAELGFGRAFAIGCAQAVALLPGISRSGSTLCAALLLGMPRAKAGAFSLWMGFVAVCGVVVLKADDVVRALATPRSSAGSAPMGWGPLALGVVVAFVVGVFAIRWLLASIARGKLWHFGAYCLAAGALGLALAPAP